MGMTIYGRWPYMGITKDPPRRWSCPNRESWKFFDSEKMTKKHRKQQIQCKMSWKSRKIHNLFVMDLALNLWWKGKPAFTVKKSHCSKKPMNLDLFLIFGWKMSWKVENDRKIRVRFFESKVTLIYRNHHKFLIQIAEESLVNYGFVADLTESNSCPAEVNQAIVWSKTVGGASDIQACPNDKEIGKSRSKLTHDVGDTQKQIVKKATPQRQPWPIDYHCWCSGNNRVWCFCLSSVRSINFPVFVQSLPKMESVSLLLFLNFFPH